MGATNIEWASHTWNPYTWNCTKVSPGCQNCYAAELAGKHHGNLSHGGQFNGVPVIRRTAWKEIRGKKVVPQGSVVFVNSMSDTFHEGATTQMIHSIFNTAAYTRPDVTFLVLTKRPERAYAMRHLLPWPRNLWMGTSVENADHLWRLDYLLRTPAAGHFLSAEPLLGPLVPHLKFYLAHHGITPGNPALSGFKPGSIGKGLDWVIVGAESGGNRRPFNPEWARDIRNMCQTANVPFMFKQGSAHFPGQNRVLDGRTWSETPFATAEPEYTKPQQMRMF